MLLLGHDHTGYQWKHLVPYLSKGFLTEGERQALPDYESRLFEGGWTLRSEGLPQFQPGKNGVGTVSEPILAAGHGRAVSAGAKA